MIIRKTHGFIILVFRSFPVTSPFRSSSQCRRPNRWESQQPITFRFCKEKIAFLNSGWAAFTFAYPSPPPHPTLVDPVFVWVSVYMWKRDPYYNLAEQRSWTVTQRSAVCFTQWERALRISLRQEYIRVLIRTLLKPEGKFGKGGRKLLFDEQNRVKMKDISETSLRKVFSLVGCNRPGSGETVDIVQCETAFKNNEVMPGAFGSDCVLTGQKYTSKSFQIDHLHNYFFFFFFFFFCQYIFYKDGQIANRS